MFQPVKKIDIHVHTSESKWLTYDRESRYATPEELIAIYDSIGVERGVLLPEISVETGFQTTSNFEIWRIVQRYPDRFSWFCNVDARQGTNSPATDFSAHLAQCRENGAQGIGELTTNLYFDDPLMTNLFRYAEKAGMPVIFHIGNRGGDYGVVDDIGLPALERTLAAFPKLVFLGHSQKFWAELGGGLTPEERDGYPTGRVAPGGRVPELMRRYPNLMGDLSAGSGYNAMTRDPEFAYQFMEEFQDRLFYGTDICDPRNVERPMLKLARFLDEACEGGRISREAYYKISRGNAERLLGL